MNEGPIDNSSQRAARLLNESRDRLTLRSAALRQTPENAAEILKARARALAQEAVKTEATTNSLAVVEFYLAHENYAIEASYVREICPLKQLTPVPCTPPFILGIVNLRGRMLTIIDIKKFFDLPERGITELNKIIVVQTKDWAFGILADLMGEMRSVPLTTIQPALPTLTGIRADYLRGVTNDRLIILNIDKILADEKIIIHEQVDTLRGQEITGRSNL